MDRRQLDVRAPRNEDISEGKNAPNEPDALRSKLGAHLVLDGDPGHALTLKKRNWGVLQTPQQLSHRLLSLGHDLSHFEL